MLHVRSFGLDQLVDDMLAMSAFGGTKQSFTGTGLEQFWIEDTFLDENVENSIYNSSNLIAEVSSEKENQHGLNK